MEPRYPGGQLEGRKGNAHEARRFSHCRKNSGDHFTVSKNFATAYIVALTEGYRIVANEDAGLREIVGVNRLAQSRRIPEHWKEPKQLDNASDVGYGAITELAPVDQGRTQEGPVDLQSRAGFGKGLFSLLHVLHRSDIDGIIGIGLSKDALAAKTNDAANTGYAHSV